MSKRKIYGQKELNFLTLTVVGWIDVFTRKAYRDILVDSLEHCCQHKGLVLHAFVIMSNHMHLVVKAPDAGHRGLSGILGDYKSYTGKAIIKAIKEGPESRKDWLLHMFKYYAKYNTNNREYQFWIQDNFPTALWSPKVIQQKVNYVHNNPVRAGWVSDATHYLYSSASNYASNNETGILKVNLLDEMYLLGM